MAVCCTASARNCLFLPYRHNNCLKCERSCICNEDEVATDDEIDDYDDKVNGADDAHGMLEFDRSLPRKIAVNCVGERSAEKTLELREDVVMT